MGLRRSVLSLLVVGAVVLPWATAATAQSSPVPGRDNDITDVPGIEVGQFQRTDDGHLTGTTVIFAPDGAVGGVDVRGGGPGTRETDLLDPRNLVQEVNAVTLSGGSAYGIDAAHGTMQWLEDQKIGYPVGVEPEQIVPIVPAAILFDLGRGGRFKARPDHEFGYKAAAAAQDAPMKMGNEGAGTGAVAGGLKGGIGTASVDLGNGIVVGAIVAVNSVGQPFNPQTCELYAAHLEVGNEFGDYRSPSKEDCEAAGFGGGGGEAESAEGAESLNTTIGLVATNFPLTKAQAQKMAGVAHDGMARAIRPVHTLFDGDSVFALSTGKGQITSECQTAAVFPTDAVCALVLNDIFSAGADAFSRAVAHAMLNAKSTHGFTSYCDTFPSACAAKAPSGGGSAPNPAPLPDPGKDGNGGKGGNDGSGGGFGGTNVEPESVGGAGGLAATGLHVTALVLLAVTSLAVGTALVHSRRPRRVRV